MTCGESVNNNSKVQWKLHQLGDTEERFIFNGYIVFQEFSEFRVVEHGRFRLSTAQAQMKHAGTYYCIRITGHNTETYSARLTILESEPICGTNASNPDNSVVENDFLELSCKIRYVGGLIPRTEWLRSDGENLTANSTYGLRELSSVIVQQMSADDNAVNYTVTTLFETSASETNYEDVIEASNNPKYEWIFSANVMFGPKDVSITPKRTTYIAGDVLHCFADGNPTPTFEWTEVGSAFYVDGPQLKVNETMALKHKSAYKCTAVNKVAGQRKIAYETVFVGVTGSSWDYFSNGSGTYIIFVGVGAAVAGVILTTTAAVMCKLSKCRRKQSKSLDELSSSHVYDYVSADDVHSFPITSNHEASEHKDFCEEIADQVMTSTKEDIDASVYYEEDYCSISGQPRTQQAQVYAVINASHSEA